MDLARDLRFLDVARSRSDARPDSFPSEKRERLLGGDPPAGGPGKEAAQRQGTIIQDFFLLGGYGDVVLEYSNENQVTPHVLVIL